MGIAAASLEGNSSEEQVQFWKIWNTSSQDERHRIGVECGRRTSELLKSKEPAEVVRRQLAAWVKGVIKEQAVARTAQRKRR
jgi:hypothetical protein